MEKVKTLLTKAKKACNILQVADEKRTAGAEHSDRRNQLLEKKKKKLLDIVEGLGYYIKADSESHEAEEQVFLEN